MKHSQRNQVHSHSVTSILPLHSVAFTELNLFLYYKNLLKSELNETYHFHAS